MALIKCEECGKEYSSNANACPNCGNPTNSEIIKVTNNNIKGKKNIVSIIVCILLLIVVFICTTGLVISIIVDYVNDKNEEKKYDTDKVYNVGDMLECPNFNVKVEKVEIKGKGTRVDSFTTISDPEWIGVTLTVTNTSESTYTFYGDKVKIVNSKGEIIEKQYLTYKMWGTESLDSPKLIAGGTKTGYIQYANTDDDNSNLILNVDCNTGLFEDSLIYRVNISQ